MPLCRYPTWQVWRKPITMVTGGPLKEAVLLINLSPDIHDIAIGYVIRTTLVLCSGRG